jgi:hypothetical protein
VLRRLWLSGRREGGALSGDLPVTATRLPKCHPGDAVGGN